MAAYVKKEFDSKYGPTWHCIVGRNFGARRAAAASRACMPGKGARRSANPAARCGAMWRLPGVHRHVPAMQPLPRTSPPQASPRPPCRVLRHSRVQALYLLLLGTPGRAAVQERMSAVAWPMSPAFPSFKPPPLPGFKAGERRGSPPPACRPAGSWSLPPLPSPLAFSLPSLLSSSGQRHAAARCDLQRHRAGRGPTGGSGRGFGRQGGIRRQT